MTEPDDAPPSRSSSRAVAFAALAVLVAFVAIAADNFTKARRADRDWSPIGHLKTIATSQSIYREGDKDGNGRPDYGTLAQLSATQLVDTVLGSGTKQGYVFAVAPSARSPELLWFATASPCTPGVTGDRYYCTNQGGAIFYTYTAAFALDTGACEIPATALPVGK